MAYFGSHRHPAEASAEREWARLEAELAQEQLARFLDAVLVGLVPASVRSVLSNIDLDEDEEWTSRVVCTWRDTNMESLVALMDAAAMIRLNQETISTETLKRFVDKCNEFDASLTSYFKHCAE